MKNHFKSLKEFIHRHKKWEPLVFFVAGFLFDSLLLHRIDDPLMLFHQAIYLTLSAFIIGYDFIFRTSANENKKPNIILKSLGKAWALREGILHFMLGTLLNVYTIFYFKSGSLKSSLIFLFFIAIFLFLNEVRPPKLSKNMLRNSLFGLCLISYFNIIVSIAVGAIGQWVFLLAVFISGIILFGFAHLIKAIEEKRSASNLNNLIAVSETGARNEPSVENKQIEGADLVGPKRGLIAWEMRIPFLAITLFYTLLYLFKILPPVPLSIKFIGIYHDVTRKDGGYALSYYRSSLLFWQNGDQTFSAFPGDKIFCFVQVFSPTNFKENLFVRWSHYDQKHGWKSADAIPLSISGGRAEGFRGFTSKSNYQMGSWRVVVETNDGREIGRIDFEVVPPVPGEARPELKIEMK